MGGQSKGNYSKHKMQINEKEPKVNLDARCRKEKVYIDPPPWKNLNLETQ